MKNFRDLDKWVLMTLGIILLNLFIVLDGSIKSIILLGAVALSIVVVRVSPTYSLVPVKINKNSTRQNYYKIK